MEVVITEQNFEQYKNGSVPLILDFWATWCVPCRRMSQVVTKISEKYGDRLVVGKCNVDENREMVESLGILNIPAVLLFKGGVVVDKVVGALPQSKLEEKIEKIL